MTANKLRLRTALPGLLLVAALMAFPAARAAASTHQQAMIEDDVHLLTNPAATLAQLRLIGVQRVRVGVFWSYIAPQIDSRKAPAGFNGANPASYPAASWTIWDEIVRDAQQEGIALDLDPMGAVPLWAMGPGRPKTTTNLVWDPSPSQYGAFVHALGVRYSGNYDPALKRLAPGNPADLPRVSFWSVWNEPNYGPSLSPQGVPGHLGIENSPRVYRELVDAAWSALHQTGHGGDTFIFGELADRDQGPVWGLFSGMAPVVFVRTMYCVDSSYKPLLGVAAAQRGCPATPAGSRAFRSHNPALFDANGISDHPYMRWYAPDDERDPSPDFTSLAQIGNLEYAIDRVQVVYGSHASFPIWDTEFGYITTPPKHDNQYEKVAPHYEPWVSQATAAYYMNWAEYISWRNPRIASFFQYLLQDALPANRADDWGGYASGLISYNGVPKATYYAWRLPLYLPVTSTTRGHTLEVWGCIRPVRFAILDTGEAQTADIQFQPSSRGAFTTIKTVTVSNPNSSCYFDVHVAFPGSGTVRLVWSYPLLDPLLGYIDPLQPHTAVSRGVQITMR